MRFSIEPKDGYLHAALFGRDTADEMRDFLLAVHAACQQHECAKVLISIRQSRVVFKADEYGLSGYVNELVTPACQVALVGDTAELHAAHEYIEVVARQQSMNVRALRDENAALNWLTGSPAQMRRYRFTRVVIAGAPDAAGVYALREGEELIYYGRADGGASTIRSRLMDHLERRLRATHYSWELCKDPAAREAELLCEHERLHGRLPRYNHDKAA